MTSACKESLFQVWEDALFTHGLTNFGEELEVGSSILALCLAKQLKKLSVTREEVLERYEKGPHQKTFRAWRYYALLAGNLITSDDLNGLCHTRGMPKGICPHMHSPEREYEWTKMILIQRGFSGDKDSMQPEVTNWPEQLETCASISS